MPDPYPAHNPDDHDGRSDAPPSPERISDAEYVVMDILWTSAPLTANDVAEQLRDRQRWSLTTVKTLLSRLMAKGAVGHEPDGRRYLYRPLIARADHATSDVKRLVDRLFGGRLSPLVAHLAQQEALTPEDIKDIEALLKELKS